MSDGRVCVLIDRPRMSAFLEGKKLTGYDANFLHEKAIRCGMGEGRYTVESISQTLAVPTDKDFADTRQRLNDGNYAIILALDETALNFTTGKRSIWKWHLSPLDALPEFNVRRVVPSFHFDQIKKEYYLNLYFEMALRRAANNAIKEPWQRKVPRYLLDPSHDETIATLESIRHKEWHSIDIETGRNQVNTFGVAWSPEDAIAIKLLPDQIPAPVHHKIWSLITELCESDTQKVMQNGIYERMYLARYGIRINNLKHDTMCAQKFLFPELEKGLDNVGRMHTMEPYWKDDGRIASEEGKQKDWGNIRDWPKHLDYNCKDSSNTLIAMHNQQRELKLRGLQEAYDRLVVQNFDAVYEMGTRGFPLNPIKQKELIAEYEAKSDSLIKQLSREINPRSSKQKLGLLHEKGFKLPTKRKKQKDGSYTNNDSADELSLKKLRLQHPEDTDLKILLEVAGIEKALSSYLRVRTFDDNRIRFSLDPHGTETGRMSCTKDPWDNGFNAQTMTDYAKRMIEWPEQSDRIFVEIDLSQAETRFVAYDACESNLIGMLERREDIHRYVAAEIYNKAMIDIVHGERQLGKKSGHGANYDMHENTFMDSCLKEMDLVLSKPMATRVLGSYHRLFPGIKRWHGKIRNEIYAKRRLDNPLGRVRYFFGRMDDNTYREGYAYRPQSTIPDITNALMNGLRGQRTEGSMDFWLHCQTHDSITLSCETKHLNDINKFASNLDLWHPNIVLAAGRLRIPTETKFGRNLGELVKMN